MERLKFEWTIPNVLSLIRIAILPLFVVWYFQDRLWAAVLVLAFSGLTDMFDGMIARRFNQITEIGKLLDPVADKLTQVTVLVCLAVEHVALIPLAVLCLIKEVLQVIGAWILLDKNATVRGSKWFGKVSTFIFYASMASVVIWTNMPTAVLIGIIVLDAALMLYSFVMYTQVYIDVRRQAKQSKSE